MLDAPDCILLPSVPSAWYPTNASVFFGSADSGRDPRANAADPVNVATAAPAGADPATPLNARRDMDQNNCAGRA